MKILVISHAYHPTVSPRAIRWAHIAREWVRKGHEVDVVTSWKPGLAKAGEWDGVAVHRTGHAMSERWRERFRERKPRTAAGNRPAAATGKSRIVGGAAKASIGLFLWMRRHTWRNLWWPDSSCLWYFPARKEAERLLRRKRHDALVSVSLPFTGHLVALHAQKQYASCMWIADSGDPFCFLDKPAANNQKLYAKKNFDVENKVFHAAGAVTVTTEETARRYAKLFPDNEEKIYVIPPLLAASVETSIEKPLFPRNGVIRLVYIGRLYRDNRHPGFLLALFQELLASDIGERLQLHFLGSPGDCLDAFEPFKQLYNNKLHIHGTVGHGVAMHAMKEADILVNIGNANSYQLPSKVVEYAKTGNPVLNLAEHAADSSASFFADYPACLNLVRRGDEVAPEHVKAVLDFIGKRHTVPAEALENFLAPFRVDRVAQEYEDILGMLQR